MNKVAGACADMAEPGRLETWLQRLVADRARLARYLLIGYWVSMLVVMLGAALIFAFYLGWWGK